MAVKRNSVPRTMRAVRLHAFDGKPGSIKVEEVPVPQPKRGQVLVKVAAASINPSDLLYIRGQYGFTREVPTVPGFVGSGVVVSAGPGLFGKMLLGKRIACAGEDDNGTWAEYCCSNAMQSLKLSKKINDEQGSMLLVNPITSMAMLQEARSRGHKAAINTAAASSVGKMMNKFSKKYNYPIINIVRWEKEAVELRELGAKHILNSSDPDFIKQLSALSEELKATIAFDAVSGKMTGQLVDAMPAGSKVYIYGRLSSDPMQIDPWKLLFQKKSVHGFWFPEWVKDRGMIQTLSVIRKVIKEFDSGLTSHVSERFPLANIHEAIATYEKNMIDKSASQGKIVLIP
jgi:NADPH:quinone reductase-like Zn-dependent oxidoreductase